MSQLLESSWIMHSESIQRDRMLNPLATLFCDFIFKHYLVLLLVSCDRNMPFIVYPQLISNWQANKLSQSARPIIISHSAEIYPQLIADWLAYSSPCVSLLVDPTSLLASLLSRLWTRKRRQFQCYMGSKRALLPCDWLLWKSSYLLLRKLKMWNGGAMVGQWRGHRTGMPRGICGVKLEASDWYWRRVKQTHWARGYTEKQSSNSQGGVWPQLTRQKDNADLKNDWMGKL